MKEIIHCGQISLVCRFDCKDFLKGERCDNLMVLDGFKFKCLKFNLQCFGSV